MPITINGVTQTGTNQGEPNPKGGVAGQMGRSSPQGRVATYHGGGRAVAKSINRSKPGTYTRWFGQTDLIRPSGPTHKGHTSFAPEQTRQYQSQQWINANYGDRSVGHYKGLQVRLGGTKRSYTKGGASNKIRGKPVQPHQIKREWHEPAPEGMVAGKWYNPADLTYTTSPGSGIGRHHGPGTGGWWGGMITGVKPEIIAKQKALASKRQRQASLVAAEKAKIAHAKAETLRLKKETAAAKAATAKHQQQLIIDKKKHDAQVIENKRLQGIEDKRLARQSKRRKHFADSEQYAVTKPKKRPQQAVRRSARPNPGRFRY